jgi:pimeloyl-ACP methyl ester carboxylesterase
MRMFAARVKNSKAVVIPETGHSGYWEQPEIFSRTVLEFIGRH